MASNNRLNPSALKFHGSRYLAKKTQVLVSTGIPSLDNVLGGGVPVGSILLIEEDEYNVFAEVLMKYFYGEGFASDHCLFVAAQDEYTRNIIYKLPCAVKGGQEEEESSRGGDYKMEIAWRYQQLGEMKSQPQKFTSANFGHHFDLSAHVPPDLIDKADITRWPSQGQEGGYLELCQHVKRAAEATRGLLRLGVHSVGGPLWSDHQALPSFLYTLRAITHSLPIVAFLTLPTSLIKEDWIVDRCRQLSDTVIRLESLVNSANPMYADYKGLLNVTKLPVVNALTPHIPETDDWAFKMLRKKFIVEKLHLPPELAVSTQREQDDLVQSCSYPKSSLSIDF